MLKKSEQASLTEVERKGMGLLEALAILMLKKEQDWEVKLLTVNFWRLSLLSTSLPPSRAWMTGLKIGCEDYESPVNLEFRKLIKRTQSDRPVYNNTESGEILFYKGHIVLHNNICLIQL